VSAPAGPPVSDAGAPLEEVREALERLGRRLDALAARLPGAAPPLPGEPLDEASRRPLAVLASLLAIGPGTPRSTALLLALDRAVYVAGADCAAVLAPTPGGELEPLAQLGFHPPLGLLPARPSVVGRALAEREIVRAGPADAGRDRLLGEHRVLHALALPVGTPAAAPAAVLLAGRRRPAPLGRRALVRLALLADRLALVLAPAGLAPPADAAGLGADLDVGRTGERIAAALARRLGAARVAVLWADGRSLRLAGAVGVPLDRPAPAPDVEPLAAVLATGRTWRAGGAAGAALADFLGAPPQLVLPLVAGGAAVGVAVAGGPAPLDPEAAAELAAAAGSALGNAVLHAAALAALAEPGTRPDADPEPAAPARDFLGLLAVVLGRVGLVRPALADPRLAGELAVAEEAAWRAAEAVRGFLGFRPGARTCALRPLDLVPVIRVAIADATRRAGARDGGPPAVTLAAEPLPPVRGDGEELREALGRVLDNAIEATPATGTVTVRARWDGGGSVEVVVEDAGPGMDDAVRVRALEPFFSTRGPGRLGLGLPVAQAIFGRHRGGLALEPGAGGVGTRVRMTVPTAAATRPGPAEGGGARVLVVEDDAAVREALVSALLQHGHAALAAGDGEEAVALLQREPLDAVVADLALAGRSGLEVARVAKRLRPGIPLAVVTAWPGRIDPAALEASGADRVLDKPISAGEVVETLEKLLAAGPGTPA